MRQTDDRAPRSSSLEGAPAALAGANTRRKRITQAGLKPLNAAVLDGSIRYGQAALGFRPLRLAHDL
jgi:hypothetical protein